MVFQNTKVTNNRLDKGSLFEFKHNFRQTTFIDCIFEGNSGYFLEANPSELQNLALQ